MRFLERQFWKVAVWLLRRGWGYCKPGERDYDDFATHPRELLNDARCAGCRASEVQDWITEHYLNPPNPPL